MSKGELQTVAFFPFSTPALASITGEIQIEAKILSSETTCFNNLYTSSLSKFLRHPGPPIKTTPSKSAKFISIVTSKSLSQSSLFGVHIKELQSFLEENGLSLKNQSECQTFVNKLQNQANEMGLIDYRFIISLTGVASSNLTFFRINSNQESKEIDALIDKISVFGWSLVIKSLDCVYFLYLGPDYEHSLSKHIGCIIEKSGFSFECFSVKQKIFRFVDYNLLYDYSSQKWLL